jgi:hypothetical protein
MVICYLNGEYTGKSRNSDTTLTVVSPYIVREDCNHIKQIIKQGCLYYLNFEEICKNKHQILWKGNQQTFLQYPEVTAKAMSKEERNNHVLPFRDWVLFSLPYCHVTPQRICKRYGKYRVIFDSSTQTSSNEVVLNQITSMDLKAPINFWKS